MTKCQITLGRAPVDLSLRFPEGERYFRRFLRKSGEAAGEPVSVREQAFADWASLGNPIDAFAEFCLFCQPVSEVLTPQDHCVFHGAALRRGDKAVLLAGGSGAGKSTHLRMLQEKHPEEFSVINGDKPVLEWTDSGVTVHPSPWNGKEGLRGAEAAPLAAIYFLRRTEHNAVEPCKDKDAGLLAFPMVFQSFSCERVIREAAAITEKLVKSCPCFFFDSRDIEPSSELLYRSIREVTRNEL